MTTIYKYWITQPEQDLDVPFGAEFLTAQVQGHNVVLWARVEAEHDPTRVRIKMRMTGEDIAWDVLSNYTYLSTVQLPTGFVWHVFVPNS